MTAEANAKLIAGAPLLLAEVERLTKENADLQCQAREEVAAIFRGTIHPVDKPIFDPISLTQFILSRQKEAVKLQTTDLREKLEKAVSVIRQLKAVSYDSNTIPSIVAMRTILESDGVVEFLAELKEE